MRTWIPVLVAAGVLASYAQTPSPPPKEAEKKEEPLMMPGGEGMLEPPGGYEYEPENRRDPFVSLLRPVEAQRGPGTRPEGIAGLLIQEVALRGIVYTPGGGMGPAERPGYIAFFLGSDGKSYWVNRGQSLYDGRIIDIDARTVTFCQDVADPITARGLKNRVVTKSLYPADEVVAAPPRPCP